MVSRELVLQDPERGPEKEEAQEGADEMSRDAANWTSHGIFGEDEGSWAVIIWRKYPS
jgi:hypothetical protein